MSHIHCKTPRITAPSAPTSNESSFMTTRPYRWKFHTHRPAASMNSIFWICDPKWRNPMTNPRKTGTTEDYLFQSASMGGPPLKKSKWIRPGTSEFRSKNEKYIIQVSCLWNFHAYGHLVVKLEHFEVVAVKIAVIQGFCNLGPPPSSLGILYNC